MTFVPEERTRAAVESDSLFVQHLTFFLAQLSLSILLAITNRHSPWTLSRPQLTHSFHSSTMRILQPKPHRSGRRQRPSDSISCNTEVR